MGNFTNGQFELPTHARGVYFVPIEHRANPRVVPVRVRSNGRSRRPFKSLFRAHRVSA